MENMFLIHSVIEKSLKKIKNPVILEFGVNRGRSSQRFLNHVEEFGGDIFSIDIKDCSKVITSKKWNFFQCNDTDHKKIINKFPKLNNGIDLLFIDSYHHPSHVKRLLEKWYIFIKKDGYIYFDDTESYLYRIKKNNILSIINDATSNVVKDFYYSNYDDLIYTKDNGYVNGIGNLLGKHLETLKPTERPIHCSDKKRLKFYIKHENEWTNDEKNHFDGNIDTLTERQISHIKIWEEKYPLWYNNQNKTEEYLGILEPLCDKNQHDMKKIKRLISGFVSI